MGPCSVAWGSFPTWNQPVQVLGDPLMSPKPHESLPSQSPRSHEPATQENKKQRYRTLKAGTLCLPQFEHGPSRKGKCRRRGSPARRPPSEGVDAVAAASSSSMCRAAAFHICVTREKLGSAPPLVPPVHCSAVVRLGVARKKGRSVLPPTMLFTT